jgi:hypothetical protein
VILFKQIAAQRHRRERLFPGLAEPAWDMLVDLMLNDAVDRRVSVTSLCIASHSPPTTGLRYVGMLVGEGLVERVPDPSDARRVFIVLTDAGRAAMLEYAEVDL